MGERKMSEAVRLGDDAGVSRKRKRHSPQQIVDRLAGRAAADAGRGAVAAGAMAARLQPPPPALGAGVSGARGVRGRPGVRGGVEAGARSGYPAIAGGPQRGDPSCGLPAGVQLPAAICVAGL